MKKFLHGLAGLLVILSTLIFGGVLFASSFMPAMSAQLIEYFEGYPVYGRMVGGLFLVLCLLYLGTFKKHRPRVGFISYASDGGDVSISVNAVRDFIRKIADEFEMVTNMEPTIHSEKETVRIDLDVKIKAGSRIPELSQMLQSRVRESVRDGLGIADVQEIKIRIQQIVGSPQPSSSV